MPRWSFPGCIRGTSARAALQAETHTANNYRDYWYLTFGPSERAEEGTFVRYLQNRSTSARIRKYGYMDTLPLAGATNGGWMTGPGYWPTMRATPAVEVGTKLKVGDGIACGALLPLDS
jgi:hypothetical protein